jgi:hypothetical protein
VGTVNPLAAWYWDVDDEFDIPLNCTAGQVMLGARDLIAEEAFAEDSRW